MRALAAGREHGSLMIGVEEALTGLAALEGRLDGLEQVPAARKTIDELRPQVASLSQQLVRMHEELLLKRWPRGTKRRTVMQ